MHRTQSDYDDNLTFKVFIFQFINFYSSIIYIAFFKGKFVGYPGNYKHIFGSLRNEEVALKSKASRLKCLMLEMQCGNGGCLIELAQQLAVIMIGKQIINNAKEMMIPMLKTWWHRKKVIISLKKCLINLLLQSNLSNIGASQMEEDYKLVENDGLFQEYLEMSKKT